LRLEDDRQSNHDGDHGDERQRLDAREENLARQD